MKVLIVDDSSFIRQYLSSLLGMMGISSVEAADGGAALRALGSEHHFDLMLLDINMPVMNGLDCVKTIRQSRLQPSMKVMMVTTEMDSSLISKALDHGADEFLMKPFTPEGLREKIMLLGLAA